MNEYVEEHERDARAWRLPSEAEECLLDYAGARQSLERAMSLSERKEEKDLKKLALLKEYESQWAMLNLTPARLQELGNYLQAKLLETRCDHTVRFTRDGSRRPTQKKLKM